MANLFVFVLCTTVLAVQGYVTLGTGTTETYNATTTEDPLDTLPGTYYILYRWGRYPGQKTDCQHAQYLPSDVDYQCKSEKRAELDVVPTFRKNKYHPEGETIIVDFVDTLKAIGDASYEMSVCKFTGSNAPWGPQEAPRHVMWKIQKGYFIDSLLGERFPMFELWSKVIPGPEELDTMVKSVTSLQHLSGHVICRQEDVPTTVRPTTEEPSPSDNPKNEANNTDDFEELKTA